MKEKYEQRYLARRHDSWVLLGVYVIRGTDTHVSIGEHRTPDNRKASKHSMDITTQARRTTRKGISMVTFPFSTNSYTRLGTLSSSGIDRPYRRATSVCVSYERNNILTPYSSAGERTGNISRFPKQTVTRLHPISEGVTKRRKTKPKGGTADVMPTIRNRTRQRIGVLGLVISASFLSQRNGQVWRTVTTHKRHRRHQEGNTLLRNTPHRQDGTSGVFPATPIWRRRLDTATQKIPSTGDGLITVLFPTRD